MYIKCTPIKDKYTMPKHNKIINDSVLEKYASKRKNFIVTVIKKAIIAHMKAGKIMSKLNLIPLNHSDDQVKRPEEKEISRFMQELEKRHFCVTRRYRRGADIDAACGELCYRENSNAQDFS